MSIVGRLVAKDLYLYRWLIAAALIACAGSLVLANFSPGDNVTTGFNVGLLLFITAIISFGISIPMIGILKERQDRSRLFVLSLPVSGAQYAAAKVGAALIAFLVPWTVLTAGVVALTTLSPRPDGGIPFFVAMMMFFLVDFCLLTALVMITLSEIWAVAGILITNISVTLFLVYAGRLPGVAGRSQDAVATWSPAILGVLAVEIAVILFALGLALYVPSRRRDFI